MIPTFRNDIEAARYTELHQPLCHALAHPQPREYAQAYGERAAAAAEACRLAARRGDARALALASLSLSTILFRHCPGVFETRSSKETSWPRKIPSSTTRGAGSARVSTPR
jgi:hypothetical protein